MEATSSVQQSPPSLLEVQQRIDEGEYQSAEAGARTLAAMSASPGQSLQDLAARDLLVEALIANGRGQEGSTKDLAQSLLDDRRLAQPDDKQRIGASTRRIGDVLFQAGEYEQAIVFYREALRVHESMAPPPPTGDVIRDLVGLSRALVETERWRHAGTIHVDHAEALAIAERAVGLSDNKPGVPSIDAAEALEARALAWKLARERPRARADFERSIALLEAAYPASHPKIADALTLLGEFLVESDVQLSRAVLVRAKAIAEASYRPGHPLLAVTLRNLGVSLSQLGDFAEAVQVGEAGVRIARDAFGDDHPLVAVQLNDLALTLFLRGDYLAARARYEQALAIYTKRHGATSIGAAAAQYNLALVSGKLGDLSNARLQFDKVSRTWATLKGPEHPDVGRALWSLAEVLADLGRDREAIPVFRRALALQERTLGANHPFVAAAQSKLSLSLARAGELKQAFLLSEKTLALWEIIGTSSGRAQSLMAHGEILARMGDVEGARRAYEQAANARRDALGLNHPDVAAADIALSTVEAATGDSDEAISRSLAAERVGLAHLKLMLASLPEREALDYAASRPRGLDVALSLTSTAVNTSASLNALILERSVVLDEMALRRRSTLFSTDPTVAETWKAFSTARQRLANLVIRGPDEGVPDRYASTVAEAENEKERAEQALAEKSAEFRLKLSRSSLELDDVRTHLPDKAALVSFVRYAQIGRHVPGPTSPNDRGSQGLIRQTPSYGAFVLRGSETPPVFVQLGDADVIDRLVSNWRLEMANAISRTASSPQSGPSVRTLGLSLRRRVWDPMTDALRGADRVFIVPDGSLNLVPFAALPTTAGHYLIEDGPVLHYLSAERDLVPVEPPTTSTSQGLLAVGGPSFLDGSSFAKLTAAPAGPPTMTVASAFLRSGSSNCGGYRSLEFAALPGSRAEAEDIAGLWKDGGATNDTVTLLTGTNATERAVKTSGAGQRILHLATHGFFLDESCNPVPAGTRSVGGLVAANSKATGKPTTVARPTPAATRENPLMLSGLALAGANRRAAAGPDEDDGILTAEEVASLNLDGVEWAVLSACDTGLGTIAAGEGVLGLRRAFQMAGARTVIMSLWSVEDRATRQYMRALYRARLTQNMDTADTTRAASLSVLRDRRAKGQSTNPLYWAAFVAAGDWR